MTMRGRFIVLEGGEGAGKSTQVGNVVAWLRAQGRRVVATREPGGTPIGERIRGVLLADESNDMVGACETLLMFAARAQHVQTVIEPALARGEDVVCDRYVDASYAYQGGGRGVDVMQIAALETWICAQAVPDCVLLLDIDPQIGLVRARQRGATDRFEGSDLDFFKRMRQVYLDRASANPSRYHVVDAHGDADTTAAAIRDVLIQRFTKS